MNLKYLSRDLKVVWKGACTKLLKRHIGPFRKTRKWLAQTQYFEAERLREIQLNLLKRIVKHAYETVPYYTGLMNKLGIKPGDINSLDDIRKFPIIRKADLKAAGNSLVSKKFNPFFTRTVHTGGTTGTPMPIVRNLISIGNEHAFVRRQFDWAGVSMNDRCAYLTWRRVAAPNEKYDKPYIYDPVMKELFLSTIHLAEDTIKVFADAIKAYKIKALVAYPSAAYILAKGCLGQNIPLALDVVLTTSETLDDAKRQLISKAFGCRVFDFYGNAERVCYIHTCWHGSYHIIPEYGLTELHPAESPNEHCHRIVATGFWNMAMPLIRYDIGDLVEIRDGTTCPCGRQFPMVNRIVGRDSNFIVTPSGRTLGAMAIEYILSRVLYQMYEIPVFEGQIVQEADDLITLEYVPMIEFGDGDAQKLINLMREEIPAEFRVDIRRVNKVNRTPQGKFLSFIMAEHH
jgi:phenylacetate-CoA ligase